MTCVPNCDKQLITEALREGLRLDRRGPNDYRDLQFEFAPDSSSCLLRLGNTRVLSMVNREMGPPRYGRDHQGSINFKLGFDANLLPETSLLGNVRYQTVMLLRWLERLFIGGNALDREALCIVAGKMVWHLQVDVKVVDYDGNILDACVLSVLGALAAYRCPQVTHEEILGGEEIKVTTHSTLEREPTPLTLHHLPIAISFAIFECGEGFVVDPSWKETCAMKGCVTCVGDPQGNILNVQKLHGVPLPPSSILSCSRLALEKIQQIAKKLHEALKLHETERVRSRVVRSDDMEEMPNAASPQLHRVPRHVLDVDQILE